MALECNRERNCDLVFVKEDWGYVFAYRNEASAHTLNNVARKAGLPLSKVA